MNTAYICNVRAPKQIQGGALAVGEALGRCHGPLCPLVVLLSLDVLTLYRHQMDEE
jgi:hypothetical protein